MKIPLSALKAIKKTAVKAAPQVIDVALDAVRREAMRIIRKKFTGRR
jgi:biotin synthase-related radical SAM superfamily protein